MSRIIDFSNCRKFVNSYEGADLKLKIEYDSKIYMLKFGQKLEPDEKNPLKASYSSAPISEYLGSHIYEIAGIPVQETLLGMYDGKVVVACKDFIESRPNADALELVEFKKLENSYLGSSTAGGRTPLYENLNEIFASHDTLSGIRQRAEERYWQMFAVDSLIGNFDRHAGNWGYILNKKDNEVIELAPVYDCGSSFYPQLNEDAMLELVQDRTKLEKRVRDFPRAALRMGKSKVLYHEFLLSPEGSKARLALGSIYPQISFEKIERLIRDTPYISAARREFYSNLIDVRKDVILLPAYELYREEQGLTCDKDTPTHRVTLASEARDARAASSALNVPDAIEPPKAKGER